MIKEKKLGKIAKPNSTTSEAFTAFQKNATNYKKQSPKIDKIKVTGRRFYEQEI